MEVYQKDNNANWFTKENLKCSECFRKQQSVIDVFWKWIFCFSCFHENLNFLFIENENIEIRKISQTQTHNNRVKRIRTEMSLSLRYKILKRDNYKCVICWDSDRIEVDHIIPVSKWWDNKNENLQTLCFRCNRWKSNN